MFLRLKKTLYQPRRVMAKQLPKSVKSRKRPVRKLVFKKPKFFRRSKRRVYKKNTKLRKYYAKFLARMEFYMVRDLYRRQLRMDKKFTRQNMVYLRCFASRTLCSVAEKRNTDRIFMIKNIFLKKTERAKSLRKSRRGRKKIKRLLSKKVVRKSLSSLFVRTNKLHRSKFFFKRVFFSVMLTFFSQTFLTPSRKGYSLRYLSELILDWKFLVKSNFERLLYRLYYYYRLSFYNHVFWKSGVQSSLARPMLSYISVKRFFFLLKKAVENRKERTFFDRLFLEMSEMLFFFESTYSLRRSQYVQNAVATRMLIHFYKRKKK